jgi:outer membrane lipopolysaccharide assembly protein LptE/RlpB
MKPLKILLLSVLTLLFSGCAGYQLGSTLPENIQSVSLKVVNKTDEPSLEVAVMKALREEVQMDGRLKLASPGEGDAVLEVTLTGYSQDALAFNRRHGSRAEEYRMTLRASSILSDTRAGEVILENPELIGEAEFQYTADLTTAKMGALPQAAGDLARKVVSLVTTAW